MPQDRVGAGDLLAHLNWTRQYNGPDGYTRYYGYCPVCGGKDRCYITDFGDYCLWWCREADRNISAHEGYERGLPVDNPAYWVGENLWMILTGERWAGWDRGSFQRTTERKKPELEPPTPAKDKANVKVTLEDVIAMHKRGRAKAIAYWGKRGINAESVDKYLLGYVEHPTTCKLPAGYTIPNIALDENCQPYVRAVDLRRDDKYCRDYLAALPSETVIKWAEELEAFWQAQVRDGHMDASWLHEPSAQELVEWKWDKYKELATSQHGIWGDDLLSLPDSSRIGPRFKAGLVVESKADAILLRQMGYPAFAYKERNDWNAHLPEVFRRIENVFIIADRDDQANNKGKGMAIAKKIRDSIKAGKVSAAYVVIADAGYKDPGEIAEKHGLVVLNNWLQRISVIVRPYLLEQAQAIA